ncbi:MAG: VWA domain-containing protein [Alphaproteobacteria bacterium]|nr:VWA domain-containing protein [Alphaproteobacteria bacterium]
MTQGRNPVTTRPGEVDAFLRDVALRATTNAGAGRGRLIFALDATASRQPTWNHARRLQGEMFVVSQGLGGLDVQLVFYRGFGECRASRWAGDAATLVKAMATVSCEGGRTQIGRVLRHAIKETGKRKVNALVLVGDALEEDVDELCGDAGRLGMLGVPIFVFHEGRDPVAADGFKQIARVSGGAYCPFDGSSANQLRELLGAVAAFAAGGRQALADHGAHVGGEAKRLSRILELPGPSEGQGNA